MIVACIIAVAVSIAVMSHLAAVVVIFRLAMMMSIRYDSTRVGFLWLLSTVVMIAVPLEMSAQCSAVCILSVAMGNGVSPAPI